MIRKRRLLLNALVSVVQVIVNGGVFLVLYRFLYGTIGVEDVGVWSVVLAWTSLSHIANLGLAGSAVKFVSKHLAREDRARVAAVIQTAALSLGAFLGVVLLGLYPVFAALLRVFIEPADKIPAALAILPYALLSFWLNAVSGVFQSCIDGFQRIDLRSFLLMGAALLYLGLALVLVSDHGLLGLAWAQVLQAGVLLLACWILLQRLLPALPPVPWRWSRSAFSEMLSYSLNFQVISIAHLLFEPTAKTLLSKFGGVAAVGYFEGANKLVFQLRALIVTAHQAIVPTIADLQERNPALIRDLYCKSYRLILFLVLPSLPILIALAPLFSRLMLDAYVETFVLYADLLFVGWFVNMLANPAYFANAGTGDLRWNVRGHLAMGALSVGLGVPLGWAFGGLGVVVAFVLSLLTGSLLIAVSYQREHRIRLGDLVQRESLWLGAAALAGLGLALLLYRLLEASWGAFALAAVLLVAYGAVVLVPLWRHPVRPQLQAWLAHLLTRRPAEPEVRHEA